MPLVCKPLALGPTFPEVLESVVYIRKQATCFYLAKQIFPPESLFNAPDVLDYMWVRRYMGRK